MNGQVLSEFSSAKSIESIISFLKNVYQQQNKSHAVIAVSGGIDSAVSLTLLTRALGTQNITPLLLPFGSQDMTDAREVVEWNGFAKNQWHEIDIQPMVESFRAASAIADSRTSAREISIDSSKNSSADPVRLGNIMARSRMIVVYDFAKALDALVCGTENKSEYYLAYFTRFGDEASDVEPLAHLYKTQVRALAKELGIPHSIQTKAPSAGLWAGQSDEQELGFSYEQADAVLAEYVDAGQTDPAVIADHTSLPLEVVVKVIARVEGTAYKHAVPYTFPTHFEHIDPL